MTLPFLLLLVAQTKTYTYHGDFDFATLINGLRKDAPVGTELVFRESIPEGSKVKLSIDEETFEGALTALCAQTSLRTMHHPKKPKTWYLSWAAKPPAKNEVRLYSANGSYGIEWSDATGERIAEILQGLTGYDPRPLMTREGFKLLQPLAAYKLPALTNRVRIDDNEESAEAFTARFLESHARAVAKAAAEDAVPKTKRAVWNLTFLPGTPPALDGAKTIDFSAGGPNLNALDLATALTSAYASREPLPDGEKAAPALTVTPVGNTLVIDGQAGLVDEVRRLLATQLDVAQSQVVLELSAYQVSADAKSRDSANSSVRKLMLAQEIARAYKQTYLQVLQGLVSNSKMGAKDTIEARKQKRGIKIDDLFRSVGFNPDPERLLGQSEMLVFLAYCDRNALAAAYEPALKKAFETTNEAISAQLIQPLKDSPSPSERELAREASELNNLLGHQKPDNRAYPLARSIAWPAKWSLLRSFANPDADSAEREDKLTRNAIESFLLLWAMTANSQSFEALKVLAKPGTTEKSAPTASDLKPLDGDRATGLVASGKLGSRSALDGLQTQKVRAIQTALDAANIGLTDATSPDQDVDENFQWVTNLLRGDNTGSLSRVSASVDRLLAIGVEALRQDAEMLVDRPLESWIQSRVLSRGTASRFGTRYGGTTTLAVTSRVPGVSGAEAESFFPSQPVAPISLGSLAGLGREPSGAPAAVEGSVDAALAATGITPLERIVLGAAFAQAEKPPYYKKLATGLHFSVLPTMLPSGGTVRLQVRLALSVDPGETASGARKDDEPGPVDLLKSSVVETELLVDAFDLVQVSSLKLDVTAPSRRDWEVPVLSQILPIRSWFVGPTQDRTVRHEAVVLVRATIIPRAMDLASRYLDTSPVLPTPPDK